LDVFSRFRGRLECVAVSFQSVEANVRSTGQQTA
jgi:hypothetical protein